MGGVAHYEWVVSRIMGRSGRSQLFDYRTVVRVSHHYTSRISRASMAIIEY
jgi:hypothetical protein